jgi:hypothetical protein
LVGSDRHVPDAADLLAVALVAAMCDRFEAGEAPADRRRHVAHIAEMLTEARLGRDVAVRDYIGTLGMLAARAIEDVAALSGEPMALWLAHWLSAPYGTPPVDPQGGLVLNWVRPYRAEALRSVPGDDQGARCDERHRDCCLLG